MFFFIKTTHSKSESSTLVHTPLSVITQRSGLILGMCVCLLLFFSSVPMLYLSTLDLVDGVFYVFFSGSSPAVRKKDFANMTSLLHLTLSRNTISQILPSAFSDLRRLRALHLDSNRLTVIKVRLMDGRLNGLMTQLNNGDAVIEIYR